MCVLGVMLGHPELVLHSRQSTPEGRIVLDRPQRLYMFTAVAAAAGATGPMESPAVDEQVDRLLGPGVSPLEAIVYIVDRTGGFPNLLIPLTSRIST